MSSVLEQQGHQLNASPTPTQVSVGPGPRKHNVSVPMTVLTVRDASQWTMAASYSYSVDRDLADARNLFSTSASYATSQGNLFIYPFLS